MRLKTIGLVLVVLFFSIETSFALTFTDSFNDAQYTKDNWTVISDAWYSIGSAYYLGDASQSGTAASAALNGQEFLNSGLSIQTLFSPYGGNGQAFFSVYEDENGLLDGYAVGIGNYYPNLGDISFNIVTIQDHIGQHELEYQLLTDFDLSHYYMMTINVDESYIYADLFDVTNQTLIASLTTELILSGNSGMIGVSTDSIAFFDDYTATGSAAPVPEPATMLLLGTGLIGLAGAGRKKLFKK